MADKYTSIPTEIMAKILAYSKPQSLILHVDSPRVLAHFNRQRELWNTYCNDDGAGRTTEECLSILEARRDFIYAVRHSLERTSMFPTAQTDLTHMAIHNGLVFCSSDDQSVRAFTLDGQFAAEFIGHTGGVWAFSIIDDLLVTGSTDKTTRVWSIRKQALLCTLRTHRSTVRAVRCVGNYIITASRDHRTGVWVDGACEDESRHMRPRYSTAQASPVNSGVYILKYMLGEHTGSVRSIDISGDHLVTGSYDGNVKLWDFKRGRFIRTICFHGRRVYIVKIYKQYVASSGMEAEVRIDSLDGKFSVRHGYHKGIIAWIDFIGNYVVTSGSDGLIIKYNYIERKVEYTIKEPAPVKSQCIAHGVLIVGTHTHVNLYVFSTGQLIRTLLNATTISKVDIVDYKIVVGYLTNEQQYIAVYDFADGMATRDNS